MSLLSAGRRRQDFLRQQCANLLSIEGLRKLARKPSIVYRQARTILFDRKLSDMGVAEQLEVHAGSIAALGRLSHLVSTSECPAEIWFGVDPRDPHMTSLGEVFLRHGSDKSTTHDYHRFYGAILREKRGAPLNILEIGLGTNNLDVPSNMGLSGKPGASLRAFRDWAPSAEIYGADVDRRILFAEERISTFWVDQTEPTSLAKLAEQLQGKRFDLIIDDGLHLPHANLNTIEALLPLLAPTGTLVVEDIGAGHLAFWEIAKAMLSARYDVFFGSTKAAHVFAVRWRS